MLVRKDLFLLKEEIAFTIHTHGHMHCFVSKSDGQDDYINSKIAIPTNLKFLNVKKISLSPFIVLQPNYRLSLYGV